MIFHLAKVSLYLRLGAIAANDFGLGPVLVVGEQDTLAKYLVFESFLCGFVDMKRQLEFLRVIANKLPDYYLLYPPGLEYLGDLGFHGVSRLPCLCS